MSANHDNIIELRQKLANAVIKSCKTKTIGYIYRDEKKKFTIGNKYLSLDNHPGNCLMQDNLEFKLKKEPLTFCFGLLRTSGSYSAQNMAGIAKILRRFKENKELNEKEKQFYKRLCKQYDGLGLTDFHRFGKATMPYSTAIFYSHPSTLEIPYERKLDYVHHIIAQELRTSLEDNVDLRRKEFYEIKKEWIDRFRTASVYILLKNITYLYNLVRKEKQKDYGENGTLIDEKKFNKDKPLLFRRYVNYLRDLTAEDENNDNLFGKVYRTFKNMPVLLPD